MSDKISSATTGTKEALKTVFKEAGSQITGKNPETERKQEQAKKIHEKAESKGRSDEEQAKIESLRKKLHQEMTAPPPKEPEHPQNEEEDKVGTNETRQDLGNSQQGQSDQNSSTPISKRKVERLKTRE